MNHVPYLLLCAKALSFFETASREITYTDSLYDSGAVIKSHCSKTTYNPTPAGIEAAKQKGFVSTD
eukprot:3084158-Amphidinium_carterae.2